MLKLKEMSGRKPAAVSSNHLSTKKWPHRVRLDAVGPERSELLYPVFGTESPLSAGKARAVVAENRQIVVVAGFLQAETCHVV